MFDKDSDGGSLNYHELLLALWCFIQKDESGNKSGKDDKLEEFTFQVYDLTETGFLSIEYDGEWGRMVKMLYFFCVSVDCSTRSILPRHSRN